MTLPDNPDFTRPHWFNELERAYVANHSKEAKAAGEGVYRKGYNYARVCGEFAESVKVKDK